MSAPLAPETPWLRLSARVVWVDLAKSILSLLPGFVAVVVVGVEPSLSTMWPLILVAVFGVTGAVTDMVRWAFTRYRVTATEIERRTGVLVRRQRKVPIERIRSVDTHAKLRHRLAGLRVVTIGAGQQTGAGEAAFLLDALTVRDAAALRRELLGLDHKTLEPQQTETSADAEAETRAEARWEGGYDRRGQTTEADSGQLFAAFRPWWVVYNMFSIWAYLMAAGLLWGLFWLLSTFGIDMLGFISRLADWEALGWVGVTVTALVIGGVVGAIGMALNYFTAYWGFELRRVRLGEKSYLRTRRGLFSTREISRDEDRRRGMSISEPLLWRWMGMADTVIITTGLSIWSPEQPAALLPRGPIGVARAVASKVLGEPSPFEAELQQHPRVALRRRLWWAALTGLAPVAAVAMPVATGAVPPWVLWASLSLLPVALLAALVAYRALGHAIVGDYLVVRAGLMSRTTSALQTSSVSTIAVRQSVLQRRLGLCTLSAMTAAGWSIYEAPDIAAKGAIPLTAQAAPGLIDEFLVSGTAR